jgi:hypothetical protein
MNATRVFTPATKFVLIWSVIIGGLCQIAMCQNIAEFSSYHAGKRYDFRITLDGLSKSPVWLDDAANPPLSPRQASAVASDYLKTLFSDAENWRVSKISLQPIRDRWVYTVEFIAPLPPGYADYLSSPFNVVVTMNGLAVPAVISSK